MKKVVDAKFLITVVTILALMAPVIGFTQNLERNIDSLLQEKYPPNEPGASFLIAKGGNIVYKKAFGLSNLELNVAMNADNVFEIGSLTKQFTAVSILMLMEKGKLNLEDTITKYIPDYPTQEHRITIHHLLTHTSGIKNFTKVKGLSKIAKQDLTPLEFLDFFKNEPMDFAPGDEFKYSNSGYVLLGYIIEKITGQSYAEFVEEHIFKKLEMTSSQYASHGKIIPNRASGYHNRGGYTNRWAISFTLPYASGSLMSNVNDLFIWQEAINGNRLISKTTTEKLFTNYTLNNGEYINYGYGWHLKSINGMESREHGGSIFGFKSMGVYLPDENIYVIGLNNCDCNSPTKITRTIAEIVSKD